jgi:inner membrane protein
MLGMGKLGYLPHHRGYAHTLVLRPVRRPPLLGITPAIAEPLRQRPEPHHLMATAILVKTLTHLALDWTNNYGVHPFWPVHNR